MYLPVLLKSPKKQRSNRVKMLYIGRFDFQVKGVDVLMKAVNMLDESAPWEMDLVGGYGNDKDEVIRWASEKKNVRFIGKWNANKVVEKMSNYDVCIVPSKYDGWNLAPLQCIHAGIGCIVTDNAGSQELTVRSGAGLMVHAEDVGDLQNAIQSVIDNPPIIDTWSDRTNEYVDKVSMEQVGSYFVGVLEYCFRYTDHMPICPW